MPFPSIKFTGSKIDTADLINDEMAKGNCIVRSIAPTDDSALTITFSKIKRGGSRFSEPWALSPDLLNASRLEISDPSGRILFRQTEVRFFEIQPYINVAAGFLTTVTYAGWARDEIVKNPMGPIGRVVLPSVLDTDAFGPTLPHR
ncbi:MAG: hypothetical protein AB7S74_18315 [Hyphomicrobium sp.]